MSWQRTLVCWFLKRYFRPETEPSHIDVLRVRARTASRIWEPKVPNGWRVALRRRREDAPLLGEWLEPIAGIEAGAPVRTLLYLHGGGYCFCSPKSHRTVVFGLATASGTRTFSLDYRLAPEHPFPAALDDALAAYRRLLADGVPPDSLVVAGDSAGGGLALALLVALRDAGDPLPAAGLLFSPWTDLAATGGTLTSNDGADPMFCGASIACVAQLYLGGTNPTNPYVSPLYAEFAGLPPLLIQASSTEVLLDDARRVAHRASVAGVKVQLEVWPKVPHAWQIFWPFLPEARRALKHAAAFAHEHARAHQVQPSGETSIA